jgi:hypothetical protein
MSSNSFFTSNREKALWIYTLIILVGIFLSLIIGRPFLELFKNQELQGGVFLLGMVIIGICIVLYGIVSKPKIVEFILILGIITVYILLFLRLGLPERSHLIEYSTLSLTIHHALIERKKQGKKIPYLSLYALMLACSIGVIDEIIQIFIPKRVFDPNDIMFNCLAALLAIGFSAGLQALKRKLEKKNSTQQSV